MRCHWLAIACLCVPLASTGTGAAATQFNIKVESNLVLVDALVLHRASRSPVGDLRYEDFVLKEDGKVQAISQFSRDELPISVVLLLDVSGSVQPILDEIQRSALEALSRLKPEDKVGLMVFGTAPVLVSGLSTDHAVVAERLESIYAQAGRAGYATFINNAVYEAARYLRRNTRPEERRAIVMVTDDVDTGGIGAGVPRDVVLRSLYETGTALCGITVGRSKAARTLMRLGTTAAVTAAVPAVGALLIASRIMPGASTTTGSAAYYAKRTGGIAVRAKDDQVGAAFVRITELLRARYTLGYVPGRTAASGGYQKIEVRLTGSAVRQKGDVTILARKGYFSRSSAPPAALDESHIGINRRR